MGIWLGPARRPGLCLRHSRGARPRHELDRHCRRLRSWGIQKKWLPAPCKDAATVLCIYKVFTRVERKPRDRSLTEWAASIRHECEQSLRRLKLDTIDLYQIHWPDPEEDIEEAWTELARLKEEGKVRYIGVSNFDVGQMQRALRIAPITSLQPPYSLLARQAEGDILPFALRQNIGVIVYSPMYSGLLSGKMTRETHCPPSVG